MLRRTFAGLFVCVAALSGCDIVLGLGDLRSAGGGAGAGAGGDGGAGGATAASTGAGCEPLVACGPKGFCESDPSGCTTATCESGCCQPKPAAAHAPCSTLVGEPGVCNGRGACVGCIDANDCGAPSCSGNTLNGFRCFVGQCGPNSAPCPGNFTCANASVCNTMCVTDNDCALGSSCSDSRCVF